MRSPTAVVVTMAFLLLVPVCRADSVADKTMGTDTNSAHTVPTSRPAATVPNSIKMRVRLTIIAGTPLDSVITSYMRREFAKIEDVELVDSVADIYVGCIAEEDKVGEKMVGYTLSIVVTDRGSNEMILCLVANNKNIDSGLKDIIKHLTSNTGRLVDHFVQTVSPDGLEDNCIKAVSIINGSDVERARKYLHASSTEEMEKLINAQ